MERYVLSCSFGKDSLASAILALHHDEPLTEALYCETMFDKEISAEVPEHRAFIYDTAIPWLENHGIKVHVVRGEKTFVELFQKQIGGGWTARGKNLGVAAVWPLLHKPRLQSPPHGAVQGQGMEGRHGDPVHRDR